MYLRPVLLSGGLLAALLCLAGCDFPMGGCEYTLYRHAVRFQTAALDGSAPRVVAAYTFESFSGFPTPGESGENPFFLEGGRTLAFTRGDVLYAVDAAGGEPQVVSDFTQRHERHHHPSPDGTQIVFAAEHAGATSNRYDRRYPELWVMDADGTDRRRVASDSARAAGDRLYATDHVFPRLLPDGRGLVHATQRYTFARNPDGTAGMLLHTETGLYLTALDGTRRTLADSLGAYLPPFSIGPGGASVVFTRVEDVPRLYRVGLDGPVQTLLGDGSAPAISPDGRRIAFQSYYGELWIMDRDGTGQRRLTGPGESVADPQWLPDGRHVLFFLQAPVQRLDVMDVETGARRVVLRPEDDELAWAQIARPTLSPDGTTLLYIVRATLPCEGECC